MGYGYRGFINHQSAMRSMKIFGGSMREVKNRAGLATKKLQRMTKITTNILKNLEEHTEYVETLTAAVEKAFTAIMTEYSQLNYEADVLGFNGREVITEQEAIEKNITVTQKRVEEVKKDINKKVNELEKMNNKLHQEKNRAAQYKENLKGYHATYWPCKKNDCGHNHHTHNHHHLPVWNCNITYIDTINLHKKARNKREQELDKRIKAKYKKFQAKYKELSSYSCTVQECPTCDAKIQYVLSN